MTHRDVLVLSGGLDSATALALAVEDGTAAATVAVDYGQRHRVELQRARALAARYGLRHVEIRTELGMSGSALTDGAQVPPSELDQGPTVVPGRNLVLAALAATVAEAHQCDRVVVGVHAGDHRVYPDCRPAFLESAARAVEASTGGRVTVHAPLLHLQRVEVASLAARLRVPIGLTWSCYAGQPPAHCGRCGACASRRSALAAANVADPTSYRDGPR